VSIEYRPLSPGDDVLTLDGRAFGVTYADEDREDIAELLEFDRFIVASDGQDLVGATSAYTLEMTVPGGAFVPTAGVTWVSVSASHRRRGILTNLMQRQLEQAVERGEPLAALTASEAAIYGRFGYGPATFRCELTIDPRRVSVRSGLGEDGLVRYADLGTARKVLPDLYERVRGTQPGVITRPDRWWDQLCRDRESRRKGMSGLFVAAHPDGWVAYRAKPGWDGGSPAGHIEIFDMAALTHDAYASLWRFMLGVDLVAHISYDRYGPHEALPWLLTDLRSARISDINDDAWARLIDVPAVLSARRYSTRDRLVIEVVDDFRPASGGRFEIDGGPDGATCRRTSAEPDLRLGASELGSISLGGVLPSTLVHAGRLDEETPGAVIRADHFFVSDPPPHSITAF
jgi:predicted acetyltransferase